jgi:hypothetical protein
LDDFEGEGEMEHELGMHNLQSLEMSRGVQFRSSKNKNKNKSFAGEEPPTFGKV